MPTPWLQRHVCNISLYYFTHSFLQQNNNVVQFREAVKERASNLNLDSWQIESITSRREGQSIVFYQNRNHLFPLKVRCSGQIVETDLILSCHIAWKTYQGEAVL